MDGRGKYVIEAGFSPSRRHPRALTVQFDPAAYARVPHPDPRTEASVATRWQHSVAANPSLFNASKFRYAGCNVAAVVGGSSSSSSGGGRTSSLVVRLGLTDYATFQGTHGVPHPLVTFGVERLARPFGNAVVVETMDGYIPFLIRSHHTGEGSGAAVLPGGHPEPSEIGISDDDSDQDHQYGSASAAEDVDDQDVCDELWNAARREVIEELFVPDERLSRVHDMRLLGIVSREADEKALMAVWAALGMTAEAVRATYLAGISNADESVNVVFVPIADLAKVTTSGKVGGIKVMPDHMGTLALASDYFAWRAAQPDCPDAAQPHRLHDRNPYILDID
jgi:8-oxo-dGTP pyrophosphatase MutT (NUDIX family)